MVTLEKRLYDAIIERNTTELAQNISLQTPEMQALITQVSDVFITSILDAEDPLMRRTKEEQEKERQELHKQYDAMFQDPSLVKESIRQSIERDYMTRAAFEKYIDRELTPLLENKIITQEEEKQIKKSIDILQPIFSSVEQLFTYLLKKAETEGFDTATTKDAENEAIRSIYPTVGEYLAAIQRNTELKREFSTICNNILMSGASKDEELGECMRTLHTQLKEARDGSKTYLQDQRTRMCEKRTAEIYPNTI